MNRTRPRLFTAIVLAASALTGCAPSPAPGGPTVNGTKPAAEVLKNFTALVDDTIAHSGTTFPSWNKDKGSQFTYGDCRTGDRKGMSYSVALLDGGPLKDPLSAAKAMRSHWKSLSYPITFYSDDSKAPHPGVSMGTTTPNGSQIVFSPGAAGTSLEVTSECSQDPAMNDTVTIPASPGQA